MTDSSDWAQPFRQVHIFAKLTEAETQRLLAQVERRTYREGEVLFAEGDPRARLLLIRRGRIESLSHGPFVMPRWDFALRAPVDEWLAFWQPLPAPGHHDLFALIKRRVLRVERDLHPIISNLFYFKALMAAPRGAQAFTPEAIVATR